MILSIFWNPNPIALDFGPVDISWYGLTWSFSLLIAYFLLSKVLKKSNHNQDDTTNIVQYVFFGALIGARIFDVFYYHMDAFLARPLIIFEVWNGGLASHGAMLGTIAALYLFSRKHKDYAFSWLVDVSALIMPILGALVRIGNFINGELYGKASSLPWAVVFAGSDPSLTPRHPVQLYEALWLLLCFALLWYLFEMKAYIKNLYSAIFLTLVLGGRFLIEMLKDSEVYLGPISNTQLLSLTAFCVGLVLLFQIRKRKFSA